MYRVERAVLLVKLKQPYLDWTRSLPNPGEFTLEGLNRENTAYLIPDHETPQAFEQIMRDLYEEIFEIELNSWCTDSTLWPKKRDYQTFKKWFDPEVHSIVLDPYKDVHSDEVSELIICGHHAICDGIPLAYLTRDILKLHLSPVGEPGYIGLEELSQRTASTP